MHETVSINEINNEFFIGFVVLIFLSSNKVIGIKQKWKRKTIAN